MKNYFFVAVMVIMVVCFVACSGENRTVRPVEDADVTADDAADETADEVYDEMSDEVSDEAEDKTSDETVDEAVDETADETEDESSDELADEVTDEVEDEDIADLTAPKMSSYDSWINIWKDGKLYSWGNGTGRTVPAAIDLTGVEEQDIIDVSTGKGWSCVLVKGGAVYCWYPGESVEITPVNVLGTSSYVKISAADGWQCGKTKSGDLECWGKDSGIIDDDPETTLHTVPVKMASDIKEFAPDVHRLVALDKSGVVYVWTDSGSKMQSVTSEFGSGGEHTAVTLLWAIDLVKRVVYIDSSDNVGFITMEENTNGTAYWCDASDKNIAISNINGGMADADGAMHDVVYMASEADPCLWVDNHATDGQIKSLGSGTPFCKELTNGEIWCTDSSQEKKFIKVLP